MEVTEDPAQIAFAALSAPVALASWPDGCILAENGRFFELFRTPPSDGDQVRECLLQIDWDKASSRIENGRAYKQEVELQVKGRQAQYAFELRLLGDGNLLLVEGRDVGKQREAEYMLESYSRMAEKNARELQREKERVEKLLLNLMPRSVYEELRDYGTTTPVRYDNASVLMLDFVNFTEMTVSREPGSLVSELNDIFSAFDRIVELFGCERIKTIGDAYIAVAGLPDQDPDHAKHLASVAVRMKRYLERRNKAHHNVWEFRIGLATGALIGSMVGIQKYVYDIFGPAANLAARLEQECGPGEILVNQTFCELLGNAFHCTELDEISLKGFGPQTVYRLDYQRG